MIFIDFHVFGRQGGNRRITVAVPSQYHRSPSPLPIKERLEDSHGSKPRSIEASKPPRLDWEDGVVAGGWWMVAGGWGMVVDGCWVVGEFMM